MNILLSMPNDQQTNNYLVNALTDMGHFVFYCDHRRHLKECMQFVPQILKAEKIDLMLVAYFKNGETYPKEYIDKLKASSPNTIFCSWIFDATVDNKICNENNDFVNLMKVYDFFFTVCRGQVKSFREQGVNAFFVQEGVDKFIRDLSGEYEQDIDVSFIGQVGHPMVHQDRLALLKKICMRFDKTKIYGPLYVNDDIISAYHTRRPTFNDIEHSIVVAKSKINISNSGWPEIDGYFSARTYRLMGSGGFVLANKTNNIEEFFVPDKEIVLYSNTQECVEKILYYLDHEEERVAIAEAGKKRTMSKYTFNHSLEKIINIINNRW